MPAGFFIGIWKNIVRFIVCIEIMIIFAADKALKEWHPGI